MAHHTGEKNDLSVSWPFTLGALFVTAALVWFCLGFALHDRKSIDENIKVEGPTSLPKHLPIFWYLLLAAAVLIVGGAIFNVMRRQKRLVASR